MKLASTPHTTTIDVDISSGEFWAKPFEERDESFARLRREAPVSWHPPTEFPFPHEETGFWAVVRNDDINTVSRQTQRFGSRYGVSLDAVPLDLVLSLSFFLTMDAPEHPRYRELVNTAFTRRQVALIDEQIRIAAREIVDGLIGAGDIDFVERCSSLLPMRTIADMMGVPVSERVAAAQAGDAVIGRSDPAYGDPADPIGTMVKAREHLYALGADLARHRRAHPSDDLLTSLVNAEVDGQRLSDDDIGAFMVLFTVAGNDTTRNTTSLTAVAFDRNPDQRSYLLEDFDARITGAVEEFVRHGSPVMQFSRTALVDTELGGQHIAAGDKVGIFYCSGNRDEAVFDRPRKFDVSRTKNPHVAFGGGGPHFCIGAGLARTQLKAIFGELLTRVPDLQVGEPQFAAGNFIRVVTALPAHIP
ncbi:MAG: cytochrome P450 [Ilumatobacteraceae bacterium]